MMEIDTCLWPEFNFGMPAYAQEASGIVSALREYNMSFIVQVDLELSICIHKVYTDIKPHSVESLVPT